MDINRKTCDIETWKKTFISRHILHQHWYICPIALPVCQNPQHGSLLTVASATCTTGQASSVTCEHPWENFLTQLWVKCFMRQTLPTISRKHFFMNILCIGSFCSQKTLNGTLLFGSTHFKHGRHFDYWNQPLNMRMCVCYLVIYIENLLHPLQLFYFHLWPIYWLSSF
jgi:hypothetical protein